MNVVFPDFSGDICIADGAVLICWHCKSDIRLSSRTLHALEQEALRHLIECEIALRPGAR